MCERGVGEEKVEGGGGVTRLSIVSLRCLESMGLIVKKR